MREVAKHCLQETFDLSDAVALIPRDGGARELAQAITNYEGALIPLNQLEPQFDGRNTRDLLDRFAPIGAVMRPDMSQEQAQFWATGVIKSLSDLPTFASRKALDQAAHVPYQFPTELSAGLRAFAEAELLRHRTALHRLRLIQEEFARMANPRTEITDQSAEPMSLDEIRKTPTWLRNLGVTSGAILQADLDAVIAEEQSAAHGATA